MTTITTTTTVTTTTTTTEAVNKARLICIADRSGSMSGIIDEAIGGLNAFVEEQKKVPGEASFTFVTFDNLVETVYENIPLKEVPVITRREYSPRGMTALLDAVGMTINKFKAQPVTPGTKTIVAITTDGEENSSHEYTHAQIKQLITHVEDELGWDVLFLGANINVAAAAGNLGVKAGKFAAFEATGKGAMDQYAAFASVTTSLRSGVSANSLDLQATYDSFAK